MNQPLQTRIPPGPPNRKRSISPLSPIGLALGSYVFFVIATLIPPGTYKTIMQEHDAMFLNLEVHAFMAGCVLCLICGASFASRVRFGNGASKSSVPRGRTYIAIPILLAAALNLISVSIFLRSNPNLLTAWITDAKSVKQDFDGAGGLTEALPLLFGVCWWGFLRLLELESYAERRYGALRALLAVAFAFAVFTALMKVARYDLMPGIFGMVLIYFFNKFKRSDLPLRKYLAPLFRAGIAMVAVFILFAWLRGNSGSSLILNNMMGYTFASYNRLTMLLEGKIHFPYGGTGTYAFRFLGNVPLLSRWIDFSSMMGMPATEVVWQSEFPAVFRAGLDGRYIWASAFGYVYSDIGMFVFLYMFVVGMVSGWLWKSLSRGKATGAVLYPWFAFSFVFWFGSNYLAYPRLLTLVASAVLLVIYEKFARAAFKSRAQV